MSFLRDHLSPSLLLNLAYLAGYHDHPHNMNNIFETLENSSSSSSTSSSSSSFSTSGQIPPSSSISFLRFCEHQLRFAAVKSLHVVLLECCSSELLLHTPPSLEELARSGVQGDRSEMVAALVDVLCCLASRATQPSELRPVLGMVELEHVSGVVSFEHLLRILNGKQHDAYTQCT